MTDKPNSALDAAHAMAAKLTEDSTIKEVRAVVAQFKVAAWPDGRVLAPGTLGWFVGDFLPRWLPMQAKDIDTVKVIELIRECNEARCDYSAEAEARGWGSYHGGRPGHEEATLENPGVIGHWANVIDLTDKLGVPRDVLLAKLKRLIEAGLVDGCACGCRGDFTVPNKSGVV